MGVHVVAVEFEGAGRGGGVGHPGEELACWWWWWWWLWLLLLGELELTTLLSGSNGRSGSWRSGVGGVQY